MRLITPDHIAKFNRKFTLPGANLFLDCVRQIYQDKADEPWKKASLYYSDSWRSKYHHKDHLEDLGGKVGCFCSLWYRGSMPAISRAIDDPMRWWSTIHYVAHILNGDRCDLASLIRATKLWSRFFRGDLIPSDLSLAAKYILYLNQGRRIIKPREKVYDMGEAEDANVLGDLTEGGHVPENQEQGLVICVSSP